MRYANAGKQHSVARNAAILAAALLPVIFSWGCAGVVSSQKTAGNIQPQTYTLSGAITPAAGGSGATITLSGATTATVTGNGSGAFSFSGLADGTYTLTPTHTGYTFSPTSQNATVTAANVTGINFTATAQTAPTYSISGTISPTAGGSGTTVTLSGAANATTTANSSGAYTFAGLANGAYTITPSNTGYTFAPASQAATVNGANVSGVNFTAAATATYSISGTISPAAGGDLATVTLSGAASATTIASASGAYTFTGLANGAYTITPSNTGYAFAPANQAVTVSGANISGVNFTATAVQTYSVGLIWSASTSTVAGYNIYRLTGTGTVYTKINPSLVTSLSYTDTSVQGATTYTYVATAVDSSGNESVYSTPATATIP